MQAANIPNIVDAALSTMGENASPADVESAAIRVLEASESPPPSHSTSLSHSGVSTSVERVVCSISLASCTSRRSSTQRSRVYDRLRQSVASVRGILEETVSGNLVPVLELHIRDSSSLLLGHPPEEFLSISKIIDRAAVDCGISRVRGPFLDFALSNNLKFLPLLPDALDLGGTLAPIIQIGTRDNGLDEAALEGLTLALGIYRKTLLRGGSGSSQATVVVNGCDRRAFGLRVHSDEVTLCPVISHQTELANALALARGVESISRARGEIIRVPVFEHILTLTPGSNGTRNATGTHEEKLIVSTLDGLPRVGPYRNRVSIPAGYDPEDLHSFLNDRLGPFCQAGIFAGIHVDLPQA